MKLSPAVVEKINAAIAEGRAVELTRRPAIATILPMTFGSEKDFQAAVVKLAISHGWKVYHTYLSRKSDPGYPDLTMVRGRSIVIAELKVEPNKPDKAQRDWLDAFKRTDADTYTWYPSDWPQIVDRLAGAVSCTGND